MDLVLRYGHIFSGFAALLVGIIPMFAAKGGGLHKNGGFIYFLAMSSVFITAIPLALLKSNYFLFSIAIFSYYAAFSGFRYVRRKNSSPALIDLVGVIITIATSLGMLGLSVRFIFDHRIFQAVVLGIFGSISFWMSTEDVLKLYFKRVSKRYGQRDWYFSHIARIGTSYIAAFTAFAVTNLNFWPSIINWLLPTVVGSIILTLVSRKYLLKFNRSSGTAES